LPDQHESEARDLAPVSILGGNIRHAKVGHRMIIIIDDQTEAVGAAFAMLRIERR
jgi:hypothetical protein